MQTTRERRAYALQYRQKNRAKLLAKRAAFNLIEGEKYNAMRLVTIRSQAEVAKILGVSFQAVQQMERRAIFKLRRALREFQTGEARVIPVVIDPMREIKANAKQLVGNAIACGLMSVKRT